MTSPLEQESRTRRASASGALVFLGFAALSVLVAALILLLSGLLPGAQSGPPAEQKLAGVLVLALLLGSIAYALARLAAYAEGRPLRMALIGLAAGVLPYFFLPLNLDADVNALRGQAVNLPGESTDSGQAMPVTGDPTTGGSADDRLAGDRFSAVGSSSAFGIPRSEDEAAAPANSPELEMPGLVTWLPAEHAAQDASPSPTPTWRPLYSAVAPLPTVYGANPPTPTLRAGPRVFVPTATRIPPPAPTSTPRPTVTPLPTSTNTAVPTRTNTAMPTSTNTAMPTSTNTSAPTSTNTAMPTSTNTAAPTSTPVPPSATPLPTATNPPPPLDPTIDPSILGMN